MSRSQSENEFPQLRELTAVLEFCGVQLQSHAALIVASFLGIIAVFQVWVAAKPLSLLLLVVLSLMMGLTGFGVVYSGLRVLVYGMLASTIMYGLKNEVRDYLFRETRYDWLALGEVTGWSSWMCYERLRRKSYGRLFSRTLHPRFWLNALVIICGVVLSFVMLASDPAWALAALVSVVIHGLGRP